MPVAESLVAKANENPLNQSQVPKQKLALTVAIGNRRDERLLFRGLIIGILGSAAWTVVVMSVIWPWASLRSVTALLFVLVVTYRVVDWWLRTPWLPDIPACNYLAWSGLIILGVCVIASMLRIESHLPAATAILLTIHAIRFRLHTVTRATVGMLDDETVKRFRRWKRLPKGLKSSNPVRGLWRAIECYLTYNHRDTKLPGGYRSPAGKQVWRVAECLAVISLLSMTLFLCSGEVARSLGNRFGEGKPDAVLFASLGICGCCALGIWASVLFAFTWRFVGRALALKEKQISPSHWRRMMDRLHNSVNKTEKESLWVGWVDADRTPILYPMSQLFKHSWIVGKTGSGKSAWVMGVILDQLIYRSDYQVVLIDLKATSNELLGVMYRAAHARHQRDGVLPDVRHFTLEQGASTHLFDIFSQTWWKQSPVPQRCSVILSALGLAYSQAYGQSFYRDSAYEFLSFVLNRHPDVSTWEELLQRMQEAIRWAKEPQELSRRCKEDAEHIVFVVKRLASLSALNNNPIFTPDVQQEAIDFSNGHTYFALSATGNGFIAGEVGRLIAASLLAAHRVSPGKKTILVIDEWQEMCTRDLEPLLTQARGIGIGVVLSNQNAAQLITPDLDMRPIVEGNTSLQAWMSVTDAVGREQVSRLGGKVSDVLLSTRRAAGEEPSHTVSQTIQDRCDANLISEVTSDARRFLLRLTDNAGYACYGDLIFVARNMFHQSKTAYDQVCKMPWPQAGSGTLVNDNNLPQPTQPMQRHAGVGPQGANRGNRLGATRSP